MRRFALIGAAVAAMALGSDLRAQAPTISDPSGRLVPGFDTPGPFPSTVTATNINIRPQSGVELDGLGEDLLETTFPSGGPIAWTSSRVNSGDAAISIGPADPTNSLYFPPAGFVNDFQAANTNTSNPINTGSHDLSALAWRVGINQGALLSTTRHNGVDDGYTISGSGGSPVGEIQGVSYFISGFSQGWGFRTSDGVFANGGAGSSDLVTGHAGAAGGRHEASFNTAAAYFPYAQGWIGAWVNAGQDGPATFANTNPVVDPSTVTWNAGVGTVLLPGVDSATDGMLFVSPSNSSSTTRIASAFPNGSGGWNTTVRLDEDTDTTGEISLTSGNDFQFLYVPYAADNLIGGHVDGATGNILQGAGETKFDLTRSSNGQYQVSVFAADGQTKKSESDGMLVLSVADTMPNNNRLGSRAMMSYEFNPQSGDFVVESRELVSTTSATPDDGFGNEFSLIDTDFYFAWIDFVDPLAPPTPLLGDYNGDEVVDAADYTVWRDGLGATYTPADYDVWQANFGAGAPGSLVLGTGGGAAVPEPTTLVLVSLGALALLATRRG